MAAFPSFRSLAPLLVTAGLVQAAPVSRPYLEVLNATQGVLRFKLPFPAMTATRSGIVSIANGMPPELIPVPAASGGDMARFLLPDGDGLELPVRGVAPGWGRTYRAGKQAEYLVTLTYDAQKISYRFAQAQARPQGGGAAGGAGQQASVPPMAGADSADEAEGTAILFDPARFLDDPWKVTHTMIRAFADDIRCADPGEAEELKASAIGMLGYDNYLMAFHRTGEGAMIAGPYPLEPWQSQPQFALLNLGDRWVALAKPDAQRGERPDFQVVNAGWGFKAIQVANDGNSLLHALYLFDHPEARDGNQPYAAPAEAVQAFRDKLRERLAELMVAGEVTVAALHQAIRDRYRVVLKGGGRVGKTLRPILERAAEAGKAAAAAAIRAKEEDARAVQQAAAEAPGNRGKTMNRVPPGDAALEPGAPSGLGKEALVDLYRREAKNLAEAQPRLLGALGLDEHGLMVGTEKPRGRFDPVGGETSPWYLDWNRRPMETLSNRELEHAATILDLVRAYDRGLTRWQAIRRDPDYPGPRRDGEDEAAYRNRRNRALNVKAVREAEDKLEELIKGLEGRAEDRLPSFPRVGGLHDLTVNLGTWLLAQEEVLRQKGTYSAQVGLDFPIRDLEQAVRGPVLRAYEAWVARVLRAKDDADRLDLAYGVAMEQRRHDFRPDSERTAVKETAPGAARAAAPARPNKRKGIAVPSLLERWHALEDQGQGPLLAALGLKPGPAHRGTADAATGGGKEPDGDSLMPLAGGAGDADVAMTAAVAAGAAMLDARRGTILPEADPDYWEQCLATVEGVVNNRKAQEELESRPEADLLEACGARARVEYVVAGVLRMAGGDPAGREVRLAKEVNAWTAALAEARKGVK